jgi:hypothetical protein
MSDRRISITAGSVTLSGVLNDTATADAIWEALPLEGTAQIWGDEIYFGIPVELGEDGAQEVVDMGALAYWPPGKGFCLFFGRTPMSRGDEIRPASPVNVFGRLEGDPSVLRDVPSGSRVTVAAEE